MIMNFVKQLQSLKLAFFYRKEVPISVQENCKKPAMQ